MKFIVGERVSWWHTSNLMRRGTIRELDTNTTIGVEPDDFKGKILYLQSTQLQHIDVGLSS